MISRQIIVIVENSCKSPQKGFGKSVLKHALKDGALYHPDREAKTECGWTA